MAGQNALFASKTAKINVFEFFFRVEGTWSEEKISKNLLLIFAEKKIAKSILYNVN